MTEILPDAAEEPKAEEMPDINLKLRHGRKGQTCSELNSV